MFTKQGKSLAQPLNLNALMASKPFQQIVRSPFQDIFPLFSSPPQNKQFKKESAKQAAPIGPLPQPEKKPSVATFEALE